ncbi:MAG: hypothetical protein ACTHK7_12430 [Aureliella sp.]
MKVRVVAIAALLLSAAGSVGWAQQPPVAIAPINNWNYQDHASTFEQGYLQGVAGVYQGVGQANYMNSLAAVNFQEAYRRQLENNRLYVQVFLERREMVRQYLDKYGNHPPTKEQLERVARNSLPDRLTADEYDPATGKLVWPHILRDEAYAPFRKRIDELMASRTPENSGDGSPWQRELHQLIDGMIRLLKQNIETMTVQQYARSKWFLVSLDYEGTLPPGHKEPEASATAPAPPAPTVTDAADDEAAPAPARGNPPPPPTPAVE